MRTLLMGSPSEVIPVLEELQNLHSTGAIELVAVVTPPPKPAGRGKQLVEVPLALAARSKNIPLVQPPRCSSEEFLRWMEGERIDLVVTAAYGQILSDAFLKVPKRAVINIHPSLLPKYRGPTPVQSTLLNQDKEGGVCILFTVKAVDAGPVILSQKMSLSGFERADSLTETLFGKGADLLGEALTMLKNPVFVGTPQDEAAVTRCQKISKSDAQIDWLSDAPAVFARFRAFWTWPGSFTYLNGKRMELEISGVYQEDQGPPGGFSLRKDLGGFLVACGRGQVLVTQLKPEGKTWMNALAFANGLPKNIRAFERG